MDKPQKEISDKRETDCKDGDKSLHLLISSTEDSKPILTSNLQKENRSSSNDLPTAESYVLEHDKLPNLNQKDNLRNKANDNCSLIEAASQDCSINDKKSEEQIVAFDKETKENTSIIDQTDLKENSTGIKPEDSSAPTATEKIDKKASRIKKWKKRMRFQPKNVTLDTEKHEYYKKLLKDPNDDTFELPRAVSVMKYTEESKKEIEAMLSAVKQHAGSKTALQILPRHLRRRAASHNIKRLPKRLRELASQQISQQSDSKSVQDAKSKVCRKKRRKKIDLQNKYAKRAGKQGWLETHLWHSKRFHMTQSTDGHFTEWKNRVAISPCDKSFRACYRAVAKHCLIQDVSYNGCIEMCGTNLNLKAILSDVLNASDLAAMFQSDTVRGNLELTAMMYNRSTLVGPFTVLWQPQQDECQLQSVLCFFHPAIFLEALGILQALAKNQDISVKDELGSLVRFRLTGPKSSVTALSVLRPFVQSSTSHVHEQSSEKLWTWIDENQAKVDEQHSCFVNTLKEIHRANFNKTAVSCPEQTPIQNVLAILVNDPRLTLPLTKVKPTFKELSEDLKRFTDNSQSRKHSLNDVSSPLWDTEILQEVADSRLPDHVVSTRKNERKFALEEDIEKLSQELATPVPVILIRRDGLTRRWSEGTDNDKTATGPHIGPPSDFGAGWDIILPKNWATAFWIPFVYHLARAGGLRESEHSHLECKVPFFPRDFPDTNAGLTWWNAEKQANHTTYYKKPPAKRPNYAVLAAPFPFAPNWEYLLAEKQNLKPQAEEMTDPTNNVVKVAGNVLIAKDGIGNESERIPSTSKTTKRTSEALEDMAPRKKAKLDTSFSVLRDVEQVKQLTCMLCRRKYSEAIEALSAMAPRTLVCVQVTPINKGSPEPQAMLCAPTSDDLVELEMQYRDLHGKGLTNCSSPVEPKHKDPFREERKTVCKAAKKNHKRKKKASPIESLASAKPFQFKVFPTRNIIGFLTSGDFLFSYAAGGGVGFVSTDHMASLLKAQSSNSWLMAEFSQHVSAPLALLRNKDSAQYRFVSLTPIC